MPPTSTMISSNSTGRTRFIGRAALLGITTLALLSSGCGDSKPDEAQVSTDGVQKLDAPSPALPKGSGMPEPENPLTDKAKQATAKAAPPSKKPQVAGVVGAAEPARINPSGDSAVVAAPSK